MTHGRAVVFGTCVFLLMLAAHPGLAADAPAPKEGHWVVRDFRFHTGEMLPEMRLHYTTIGAPTGEPVLILHGTTGTGAGLLAPAFGGELFGPGQPLDASRDYVILPDAIGHGKSSKPSDGLRTRFPRYNYDDMVQAHYRLLTEHLGVRRLRLVLGNSMGGMEVWIFAQKYPAFMDLAVAMASLPTEMASNYTKQPRTAQVASVFYGLATSGGNHATFAAAPTREKADQLLNQRLAAAFTADANDVLYQWDSSGDYNPSAGLERIQAVLLAINSADDERNPPELGILEREIKRVKHGRHVLIPASEDTRGHGTTGLAKLWKHHLAELLRGGPPAAK